MDKLPATPCMQQSQTTLQEHLASITATPGYHMLRMLQPDKLTPWLRCSQSKIIGILDCQKHTC